MNVSSNVRHLIDELDALAKTRNDAWQIPRAEGEFLHNLALATRASMVVEVGTSYGFSGLFWGSAMLANDGHFHTIDRDPKKYDSSKLTFTQAGLNGVITNYLGDARKILSNLRGPYDIVFIDADKESCIPYFELVWPNLRVGGSVLTDNSITHAKELAEFVKYARSRPDATSTEVPVGNGLEWTVKLRA
jgi:predicted O-methyltransferase YrrM